MKRRGPLLFLMILILVIVFIVGTRYGTEVEKTNKAIGYIISLTPPTRPPTATPTPFSLKYKLYTHKQCAVSFAYPELFKLANESSQSALFTLDTVPQVALSCEAKKPKFSDFDKYTMKASESARINTVTGKTIYFKLNPDAAALLDSSLKYGAKQP